MLQLASIMLGGALGAVSRYLLSNLVYAWLGRGFPYGTLTVNILGSFLMGFLMIVMMSKGTINPAIKVGVLVGFLGSLTTFSTFSLDTLTLLEEGALLTAVINIFISVIVCITAVWVGMQVGKQI